MRGLGVTVVHLPLPLAADDTDAVDKQHDEERVLGGEEDDAVCYQIERDDSVQTDGQERPVLQQEVHHDAPDLRLKHML